MSKRIVLLLCVSIVACGGMGIHILEENRVFTMPPEASSKDIPFSVTNVTLDPMLGEVLVVRIEDFPTGDLAYEAPRSVGDSLFDYTMQVSCLRPGRFSFIIVASKMKPGDDEAPEVLEQVRDRIEVTCPDSFYISLDRSELTLAVGAGSSAVRGHLVGGSATLEARNVSEGLAVQTASVPEDPDDTIIYVRCLAVGDYTFLVTAEVDDRTAASAIRVHCQTVTEVTNLTAMSDVEGGVVIRWQAGSSGNSFVVERSWGDCAPYERLRGPDTHVVYYDPNASPNAPYRYRVRTVALDGVTLSAGATIRYVYPPRAGQCTTLRLNMEQQCLTVPRGSSASTPFTIVAGSEQQVLLDVYTSALGPMATARLDGRVLTATSPSGGPLGQATAIITSSQGEARCELPVRVIVP
jgi:hypothetical protein